MSDPHSPRQQPLIKIAGRTLLALTCWGCGKLLPGTSFERRARVRGGVAYLDRRCGACRWAHLERSYGR